VTHANGHTIIQVIIAPMKCHAQNVIIKQAAESARNRVEGRPEGSPQVTSTSRHTTYLHTHIHATQRMIDAGRQGGCLGRREQDAVRRKRV
jgi:hypothetical protein